MASFKKKISEKTAIANRYKQFDNETRKMRKEADKDLAALMDAVNKYTPKKYAILTFAAGSNGMLSMLSNFHYKPTMTEPLAQLFATTILRIASCLGITNDRFLGKIVSYIGLEEERLLSGDAFKAIEEMKKDDEQSRCGD